jgi:membrane protease YdiL (CAAX protease family)
VELSSGGGAADPVAGDPPCRICRQPITPGARFCRSCGADQQPLLAIQAERRELHRERADWRRIKGVVVFYAIYLASVLPVAWQRGGDVVAALLVASVVDALVILAYWRWSGASLGAALRLDRRVLAWCALAPLVLLLVLPIDYAYHQVLRDFFGVHRDFGTSLVAPFTSAGYGLGAELFCIALMPGVWEELAFRGLILGQLQRSVGAREAIVLSALLFGVIHLAWLSLPYLVGLGVLLAALRQRSGSLLPGMVLHAAHNGVIVLLVTQGW